MSTPTAPPLLECRSIRKRFGGVAALEGVDFALQAGEVHGLVGSNGAGKSTLMKILAGAVPDFEGTVSLDGRPLDLSSPQAALAQGIAMVYQELSGIGQLSVAENLLLGRQPTTRWGRIDWRAIRRMAREYLAELEIQVEVTRRLDSCPLAIRQMVEISRGLHSGARVLILDEPTSALSPLETQRLFALIQRLRRRGVAMVFISHFIEDVLTICDRVTILRNGRLVHTAPIAGLDKQAVIHAMLDSSPLSLRETTTSWCPRVRGSADQPDFQVPGSGVGSPHPRAPRSGLLQEGEGDLVVASPHPSEVFVARDLSLSGYFSEVNLTVSRGECLGIYGFVGAGHQELVHALAGSLRPTSGQVLLDGRPLPPGSPHHAVRRGVVLVAADRAQGLFLRGEVYKNVTLPHLRRTIGRWLITGKEAAVTRPLLARAGCRPPDPYIPTGNLSGGNQQKVALARWLLGPLRVLLLEEPTRGMDVEAKQEVMQLVAELKRQGLPIVLASSEPEMVLAHADRILVMSRGQMRHEFVATRVDKAGLMRYV